MMEIFFKAVLLGYFILFVSTALLYRSYLLYRKTGINALAQSPEDSTLKIVALILKVHLAGIASLIVDYVYGFAFLSANRFEWMPAQIGAGIGSLLLIFCFIIIISAQQQMETSWRIEIDPRHQAQLITRGLFKYSRNPIFLALRLSYFAMFLIIPCPFSLTLLLIGDFAFQFQAKKEECYLSQTYGDDYADYCQKVRRWL